jgi:Lrp/AsnC family leucine-responsive transcriptional regulator
MIDDIDRQILSILQTDARTSNAELARRVGMAASATLERLRKLEQQGVITGYVARLDPGQLDAGLLAFVFVRSDEGVIAERTEQTLARIPEVQEVHHIAGDDCFLLKVRTADTASLGRLLRERIGCIPTVRSTRTTVVLQTVKDVTTLPVGGAAAVAEDAVNA